MITPGTLLLEKGTPHPSCLHLEDTPYPKAWIAVKHELSPDELEQELAARGWTLSLSPSALQMTAFGFNRAKMIASLLRRLIDEVNPQDFNCLEIDGVETRSFFWIPYISVTAHARHLHKDRAARLFTQR